MKKLTVKFLESKNACESGTEYAKDTKLIGMPIDEAAEKLLREKNLDWANWLISQSLDKTNCIRYAIYAAEQVIKIYEDKYPDDKRPRNAIKAAEKCLKKPTEKNKKAAYAASAADAAARAAYAAADAAARAADAAASAAYAASAAMKEKIIRYGLKILRGES